MLILRLIESSKDLKVGDLFVEHKHGRLLISMTDVEDVRGVTVVKPYGVADIFVPVKTGDLVDIGGYHILTLEKWDEESMIYRFVDSEAVSGLYVPRKVEILPEQFDYQQLVDMQLKDGDELHVVDMIEDKAVLYMGHLGVAVHEEQRPAIDSYHNHELLDRLHIVCSNIDDHIVSHPVCEGNPEIEERVQGALELLFEAYQLAGNLNE